MTLIITVNCSLMSSLNWDDAKKAAQNAAKEGNHFFWELNMGLFDQLEATLSDEAQLAAFQLNVERFATTLLEEFKEYTRGVVLYRGDIDFSHHFPWSAHERALFQGGSEAIFCRDVCLEYLKTIAQPIQDEIPLYIFLDASHLSFGLSSLESSDFTEEISQLSSKAIVEDAIAEKKRAKFTSKSLEYEGVKPKIQVLNIKEHALALRLLSKEAFDYFHVVCTPDMVAVDSTSKYGILLPTSYSEKGWDQVGNVLQNLSFPCRFFYEMHFEQEWEGLDTVLIFPDAMTVQGKRKIAGFQAAGGRVIAYRGASNTDLPLGTSRKICPFSLK